MFLHLPRQHRRLLFVEQRKQRNMFQNFGIARHRPPRLQGLDQFLVFQTLESSATSNIRAPSKPDDWGGFKKDSAKVGEGRRAESPQSNTHSSLNDLNLHVLSRGMLRQQRGHSLRPAL